MQTKTKGSTLVGQDTPLACLTLLQNCHAGGVWQLPGIVRVAGRSVLTEGKAVRDNAIDDKGSILSA